jgi:tellurite resistance protein
MIDHLTALIYTMILVSAADRNMTDAEVRTIGEIVRYLPIFKKFDPEKLPRVAADCAEILDDDEGLDTVLNVIKGALPQKLHETAYAMACDVAAADGRLKPEVIRLLELLRHALDIDRLAAAAIERGARARHAVL